MSGIYYGLFSDKYYLLDFNNIVKFLRKSNNPVMADPKISS